MPPPASQESPSKSSLLLALVCASIVADYDRSWLARPVAQLIPERGPRPEWVSRVKVKLRGAFADLVEAATRRGRRPTPPRDHRAPVLEALLATATRLLALSAVPVRRRAVQDELVCAFDRVHRDHGVTARAFCAALALPERTFRSWQDRPAKPPPPPPPPKPPSPPPNDRNTGRFALEATPPIPSSAATPPTCASSASTSSSSASRTSAIASAACTMRLPSTCANPPS